MAFCARQMAFLFFSPLHSFRSSLDDYCPKKQVGRIQELVIKMLNDLYTDVEVQKDYEDEIVSTSSETKT